MSLSGHKILRNFGSLSGGKLFGDVFTFLLFVALSRSFGQEGIGQYSFAMALTGFLVVIADFGLSRFAIKEMSQRSQGGTQFYDQVFSLRVALSVIVFMVFGIALAFLPFSDETKIVLMVIGGYQLFIMIIDILTAALIVRDHTHLVGLLEFSLRAITALVGIVAIFVGAPLVMVLLALPAVTLIHAGVAYVVVSKIYHRPNLTISRGAYSSILPKAVPYALFIMLHQISTRTDIVFLGFMLGAAAAGIYNVAYRIVFLLLFLAFFAELTLLPLASRLYIDSKDELAKMYHKSLSLVIVFSFPISAGLWLIAPDLIVLIFGEEFNDSGTVLRFLAWLVFLAFLKDTMGLFLTASDQQGARTRGQWTGAWVNVGGNLILIPTVGVVGAAIATLISEALIVVIYLVKLKSILGWPRVSRRVVISVVAVSTFCVPFTVYESIPLGVVIPASVLLYVGTIMLFQEIRNNEAKMLLSIVRGQSKETE